MSSIGQDLSRIRHLQKLTLQDLHKRTRISLDILEKLEDGRLFEEPVENEVYARSYTRTYARALGISEELITTALDQQKKGEYEGILLEPYPGIIQKTTAHSLSSDEESSTAQESEPSADKPSSDKKRTPASGRTDSGETKQPDSKPTDSPDGPGGGDKPPKSSGSEPKKADRTTDADSRPTREPKKGVPGAGKAEATSPNVAREKKPADQIDWAAMGQRFSAQSRRSSGWILGLGLVLVFVAAVLWIAFRTDLMSNLFNGEETAQERVTEPQNPQNASEPNSGLSLELGDGVDASPEPAMESDETTPVRLDSTLYLTIYGARGALDPVRVWSDLKPRFDPYWIEQGEAMQFEFRDTIRVRSQYSESLLFLNGHRIENSREQYYNSAQQSVELTRELFTPEADWAAPREFELPDSVAVPDTVRMRPTFN